MADLPFLFLGLIALAVLLSVGYAISNSLRMLLTLSLLRSIP